MTIANDDDDGEITTTKPLILKTGAKIACYSNDKDDDDLWYEGTVEGELGNNRFWIQYNNGTESVLDAKEDTWRKSTLYLDEEETQTKRAMVHKLKPGSRIAVYFPFQRKYYNGTLTIKREEVSNKGIPHHIRYDNQVMPDEWTDLMFRKFRTLPSASGSRAPSSSETTITSSLATTMVKLEPSENNFRPDEVNVSEQESSRREETIMVKIEPSSLENAITARSDEVSMSEQEHGGEETMVKIEPSSEYAITARPDEISISEEQPEISRGEEYQPNSHALLLDTTTMMMVEGNNNGKKRKEGLFIVDTTKHSDRPLKRTRGSENRQDHDEEEEEEEEVEEADAPECEATSYCSSKEEENGEILVIESPNGAKMMTTSTKLPKKAVEQVDLTTGEIIATFPSAIEAAEATGIHKRAIRRVLNQHGKAKRGGYLWRYQGETHETWLEPKPNLPKPVEQLDWATGEVLVSYKSVGEAKRRFCLPRTSKYIQHACDGKLKWEMFAGFFWRWKGSDSLPKHLTQTSKEI